MPRFDARLNGRCFVIATAIAAGAWATGALSPRAAQAHFNLVMPPPADSATDGGKGAPPCGPTTASNVVTSVQGGHAITLALDETVMHPGWYRVALSINSRSELPADPAVTTNAAGNSTGATFMDPPMFPVLADHIFNHTSGTVPIHYTMSLTLPNVTCTKCTLQVIEFMNMHGSNPGGGYFYHHCADLKITADPALPPFSVDGGVPPDGGSPGTGGRGGAGGSGAGGRGGAGGSAAGNAGTTGGAGRGGNVGTTGSAGTSGAAGTGSGATGGNGGNVGSTGSAGSNGSTGAAGTTGAAGNNGSTGAAGTGTTTGTGTAGTKGGGGSDSSGGCAVGPGAGRVGIAILLALVGAVFIRRRRQRARR